MNLWNEILHCLRLDFEARAEQEIERRDAKIARLAGDRNARGNIPRHHGFILTDEALEKERESLKGLNLAG